MRINSPALFAALATLASCSVAGGEIYKCQTDKGVTYSQSPCGKNATIVAITPRDSVDVRRMAPEDYKCMRDNVCWSKRHMDKVVSACSVLIEQRAKIAFQWQAEGRARFSSMELDDRGKFFARGDRIKMQNAMGVWVPQVYSCEVDPLMDTAKLTGIGTR